MPARSRFRFSASWWISALMLLVAGAVIAMLYMPGAGSWAWRWLARLRRPAAAEAPAAHDDHDHHDEATAIEISPSGLGNIGYQATVVALGPYPRTVTLPGQVAEWPGRSQIHVTAPLTGIVTDIRALVGAAVPPGAPLFELRLTHEDLVATQREFLTAVEQLEIARRELNRLRGLGDVVAGSRALAQEYEIQKLEATLRADRQALLLHGLSAKAVDSIQRDKQMFQSLTVSAPAHQHQGEACAAPHAFHLQTLSVHPGEHVEAGATLCVLADHCELRIEGRAFENDAEHLRNAMRRQVAITAALLVGERKTAEIPGLRVLRLADHVDERSRALHFYLALPNQLDKPENGAAADGAPRAAADVNPTKESVAATETLSPNERGPAPDTSAARDADPRYVDWSYKPGQRLELRVPFEEWSDRIVLPVEAIIDEGVEVYVYRRNGRLFERKAVRVEHRDQRSAVLAYDGALFPGDEVASRGAYQIHLALKKQTGGAVDPHAGHTH